MKCHHNLHIGEYYHISSPGDIILGGLFPVHKEGNREDICGEFNEIPGYQYMEAMRYAVNQINKRNDILPGIRLGTIIYDTCRSPTITADHAKDFIELSLQDSPHTSEFAGVIGPFTSGNSIIAANFLRVFEIPQISYGGLTVELSNKDLYDYFFRTVPPDSFFAEGLARLLDKFRWNYVSIIYSTGKYPETGTEEIIKALMKRTICIAKKHKLPRFPSKEDFNHAISEVISVKETNVIVFVTIQRDSRGLLKAKKRNPLAKTFLIVASVSWSNRDDITKGLGVVAEGTITFGHLSSSNNTEFEHYFRSLNLSNYPQSQSKWYHEFWERQFNCFLGNNTNNNFRKCTGKENLASHHMEIAPVRVVINAVNAMAYSLENMRKSLCPNISGLCSKMKQLSRNLLKKFMKNVTFQDSYFKWPIMFNENNEVDGNYTVFNFRESKPGVFSYIPVGNWTSRLMVNSEISGELQLHESKIRWPKGLMVPISRCSQECTPGYVKERRYGAPELCCWDCVRCKKYDIIMNHTCRACAEGYVPDANFSRCLKRQVKSMSLRNPIAVSLVFLSVLGIIINLTALVVFYMKRKHQLIKATNIEASYFIFSGLFLIFIIPIMFLAKPTENLCYAQRFALGNSFTVCYAALLVKLTRIHLMCKNTVQNTLRKQQESTYFINLRPHLVITISIIIIQLLLTVALTTRKPPNLQENFHFKTEELVLECSLEPTTFVAYIAGNVILVSACSFYAFLTRSVHKNFRETLYIGFTTYISNVLWVILLAIFLNSDDSFSRQYLIAGISLLIGWLTFLGLFAPVFYNLRTRNIFDSISLFNWGNSTTRRLQDEQSQSSLNNTPQMNVRTI